MLPPGESLLQIRLARAGFRLDLDVAWSGRVAVLFGPSGSGKSTVFECILGLHRTARSRVCLAGEWLEDRDRGLRLPVEARGLGWVPQSPTLFPHLDVAGNLRFGLARAGDEGARALARAVEVLEIGGLLGRRVTDLSGGERSRVALARAIASGPRVLLLDEPLAALDLPLRARILPYLLRVRDELGLPMLTITHDPDEAMLLGGTVVVLDGGRLVAQGSAREVLWSRAVLPLSEALGLENVLAARSLGGIGEAGECLVETPTGLRLAVPWPLPAGVTLSLGVPAQDVLIAAEAPQRLSARNVLPCRVVRIEARDGDAFVHLDAGEPLVAKLTPAAVVRLELEPGRPVFAVVKAQALRRLR